MAIVGHLATRGCLRLDNNAVKATFRGGFFMPKPLRWQLKPKRQAQKSRSIERLLAIIITYTGLRAFRYACSDTWCHFVA